MLEFVFFHQSICDTFTEFLVKQDVEFQLDEDDGCFTVSLSEELDDALIDEIDSLYDRLMDESRDQVDGEEGEHAGNYQKASLLISLQNGETTYAHVDSEVLSRVLEVISKDELGQFIHAVVSAVENQDARSYCQIMRDMEHPPPQD